jgi:hypothetical protein
VGLGIRKRVVRSLASIALKAVRRSLESGEQGEGARTMWNSIKNYLNGKKRYTGALMIAWPGVIAVVAKAMESQGFDATQVAIVATLSGGITMSVIGWIHWVVKQVDDMTPDE